MLIVPSRNAILEYRNLLFTTSPSPRLAATSITWSSGARFLLFNVLFAALFRLNICCVLISFVLEMAALFVSLLQGPSISSSIDYPFVVNQSRKYPLNRCTCANARRLSIPPSVSLCRMHSQILLPRKQRGSFRFYVGSTMRDLLECHHWSVGRTNLDSTDQT